MNRRFRSTASPRNRIGGNVHRSTLRPSAAVAERGIERINKRRVQVLLVKNEKEHAWAINSRNID